MEFRFDTVPFQNSVTEHLFWYEILSTNEKGLRYCQEQYQFILADEMQDTNAVQYEIIIQLIMLGFIFLIILIYFPELC